MADVKPLKLEYDGNGTPSGIGEFTSGDTIETAIVDLALPGLTDVSSTLSPSTGDSLVYTGSTWSSSAIAHPSEALSGLTDVIITDITVPQHLQWNGTSWVNAYEDEQYIRIYNSTGSTITKGEAVCVSGAHNQNVALVGLAKADSSNDMPALGLVYEDILNASEGVAVSFGRAQGVATGGFSEGQTVYVSPTTAGGVTNVRPTATNHLVQNVGIVMKSHVSNGVIKVTGVGRTNDIPNMMSSVIINTTLSAGPSCSVKFDLSAVTVSSCPVPPPWSFTEVTADDGTNSASPYYFASGSTQAKTEIDAGHITWDSTNSYFTIANAGYYEFEMQGSVIVAVSPTDVTTSIIQTTGLGGTEVEKIDKLQRIRTNIDPHDIMIKWVGYVEAAKNFTCKIDGTAAVVMQKGSTFTCKRIN